MAIVTNVKHRLLQALPVSLTTTLKIRRETRRLRRMGKLPCDVQRLRSVDDLAALGLFAGNDIDAEWSEAKKELDRFVIPDATGGVNPGDRRAIYHLIRKVKPTHVLEIGTHIGASTLHIASALFSNQSSKGDQRAMLVSVDIANVNDTQIKPWLKYGAEHSPIDMMTRMHFEGFVEFKVDRSLDYFARCDRKFDFIFLDGDHSAATVYQEIPAALNILSENGLILLHDYFPNLKPLWSDGAVIPGPFLATERLKAEGTDLVVLPLGELPWPTKLRSNRTSLALLARVTGASRRA